MILAEKKSLLLSLISAKNTLSKTSGRVCMIKLLLISALSLNFLSCSLEPKAKEGVPTVDISDYENLVEKNTKNIESYNGLSNQLNAYATKLDSKMTEAMMARSGQIYQWNSVIFQEEKTKAVAELATKTIFFLSFYTPERNHNNLTAKKPIWKIYLDVGGQRYEGSATKIKTMLADLESLYPHHNRFATPYKIEFSVPTVRTENEPQVFTITGPSASVVLNF
jgi:hypothetical protein